MTKYLTVILVFLVCQGCAGTPEQIADIDSLPGRFQEYWHQGKAEISRYELHQARYGESHDGYAVMIFVTEDFLADLQVKKERGDGEGYPVLKLNATRNFVTGIYPYSLMTSVFTEVRFDGVETPKVTFTSQEWCGQVYMQLNLGKDGYRARIHSYFQNEADQDRQLPRAVLEDELWTAIRVAPNHLPTGDFPMIPSLQYLRLMHREPEPRRVTASLSTGRDRRYSKQEHYVYSLTCADLDRELVIHFEKKFPFGILGWQDTYVSGFGPKAKKLTTTAVRTHSVMEDYWNKNKKTDGKLRTSLGLD